MCLELFYGFMKAPRTTGPSHGSTLKCIGVGLPARAWKRGESQRTAKNHIRELAPAVAIAAHVFSPSEKEYISIAGNEECLVQKGDGMATDIHIESSRAHHSRHAGSKN